jgi:hypothetical protein
MITWKSVIAVLGGQAIFLTVAGWLFKTLTTRWLERDTERFKSKLELAASVEVEQLKSSLQMVALEHQVRFTKLHERRAEVIADLYKRLINLVWTSQQFVLQGGYMNRPNQEEEFSKANNQAWEFANFVDTHRIYLPESICGSLDTFTAVIRKKVINVGIYSRNEFPTGHSLEKYGQELISAVQAFEGEIPRLRIDLESEFRKILGAEQSEKALEVTNPTAKPR